MSPIFLFALFLVAAYAQDVYTAEETCECAEKLNKALVDSLKGCVEATDALINCEEGKPLPRVNTEWMLQVKMEADSCSCAKKVTKQLTNSLDGCIDAVKQINECNKPN